MTQIRNWSLVIAATLYLAYVAFAGPLVAH